MPPLPTMLPPVVAKLLVGKQEAKSRAAEGWYRLRIYGADVLSAFPKLDLAANLARFARAVAPPVPASTLSDKQATLPAVCPEPEGTAIEAKRQAATIAAASEPEVAASAGDIGEAAGSAATQPKRRRRLYEPTLDDWLRSQKINVLVNADREILAKKFDAHCREHRPDVAPLLPLRPRQMVGAIERHIAKRLKKIRQKAKIVASANSGQ